MVLHGDVTIKPPDYADDLKAAREKVRAPIRTHAYTHTHTHAHLISLSTWTVSPSCKHRLDLDHPLTHSPTHPSNSPNSPTHPPTHPPIHPTYPPTHIGLQRVQSCSGCGSRSLRRRCPGRRCARWWHSGTGHVFQESDGQWIAGPHRNTRHELYAQVFERHVHSHQQPCREASRDGTECVAFQSLCP